MGGGGTLFVLTVAVAHCIMLVLLVVTKLCLCERWLWGRLQKKQFGHECVHIKFYVMNWNSLFYWLVVTSSQGFTGQWSLAGQWSLSCCLMVSGHCHEVWLVSCCCHSVWLSVVTVMSLDWSAVTIIRVNWSLVIVVWGLTGHWPLSWGLTSQLSKSCEVWLVSGKCRKV